MNKGGLHNQTGNPLGGGSFNFTEFLQLIGNIAP